MEIRLSQARLISTMRFPLPKRWHFFYWITPDTLNLIIIMMNFVYAFICSSIHNAYICGCVKKRHTLGWKTMLKIDKYHNTLINIRRHGTLWWYKRKPNDCRIDVYEISTRRGILDILSTLTWCALLLGFQMARYNLLCSFQRTEIRLIDIGISSN